MEVLGLIQTKQSHLLKRACFGPKLEWLSNGFWGQHDIESLQEEIWDSLPAYKPLADATPLQFLFPEDRPEEERLHKQDAWGAFLANWVNQMVELDNPLREIAALFWHHHIPSASGHKFAHGQLLLEIYREHGLGYLRPLLVKMAANPAIMYFLDGHHSHKDNPNENFPRELLELFTLGEGQYTEQDVYEAARAFTGRRFDHQNYPYAMYVDEEAFDNQPKTFLGRTGNFRGEDIIDILLHEPATARHIAKAILQFFGASQPLQQHIAECGQFYFDSGFHTGQLLRYIFSRDWFYQPPYTEGKVKTPVELLVNLQRTTGMRTVGLKTTDSFLRACGQSLFAPPNVAGWPVGDDWLKGNKLLYRLFLPKTLLKIANRKDPKTSLTYKAKSRLQHPELRTYRYIADATFDEEKFIELLSANQLSISQWLGVNSSEASATLADCLTQPDYQYA